MPRPDSNFVSSSVMVVIFEDTNHLT
ncbi:hypothetical protein A2U01_0115182, partial [Trifolium medium]|nr:hypothetical protein [Trifolium medium]